ncbi:MAG: MarR family transcriptional regulator [Caulobacteraceae bacterium]|nr:MarR family transcriptional regulator [Caulobacteraceae bacterium]
MAQLVLTKAARDDILALAEQLRPAVLRVARSLRREAQRAGMSALDVQLLAVVRKHPGIGVSGLAELEQVSAASMSGHVKRLAEAGWIERTAGEDRRRSGLTLTHRGAKALDAIRRRRNDWLAARLGALAPEGRAALAAAAEPLMRLAEERP